MVDRAPGMGRAANGAIMVADAAIGNAPRHSCPPARRRSADGHLGALGDECVDALRRVVGQHVAGHGFARQLVRAVESRSICA